MKAQLFCQLCLFKRTKETNVNWIDLDRGYILKEIKAGSH